MSADREAVARIVAPHAWADYDHDRGSTPWGHPYIQESLRKADDILAYLSHPLTHPETGAQGAGVELLLAAQALGAMPEGYCFCSRDRIGDDSKTHEPECRDLRAAIAKSETL